MDHVRSSRRGTLLLLLFPVAAASCSGPGPVAVAPPEAVTASTAAAPSASASASTATATATATAAAPIEPPDPSVHRTSWCPNGTPPAPAPGANDLTYALKDRPGPKGFVVSCPIGLLCDEKYDYRAVQYKDDAATVYLSFDGSATNAKDLASLQRAFHYANVILAFPKLAPRGYRGGAFQTESPSCNVELRELKDGRLRGVVWGIVDLVAFEKQNDPKCHRSDGPIPLDCSMPQRLDKPFRIEFDLTFPNGPQDCRGAHAKCE